MMAKQKRKRKGLLKHKEINNQEHLARLLSAVHNTDGSKMIEKNSNLLNVDYTIEPSRVATVITNRFKNGDSAEDIAYYNYDILTDVLTHLKVPGRSEATTKMEKANLLYKFIMKDSTSTSKKKSTKVAKTEVKKVGEEKTAPQKQSKWRK